MGLTKLGYLLLAATVGVGIIFIPGYLSTRESAQKVKSIPTPAVTAGTTHTLEMDGTTFKPAAATIVLGDTVVWTNDDPFPHTATATGGAFDSKPLAPGQSFTFKPAARGDYPYKCTLHPTMLGVLHVK